MALKIPMLIIQYKSTLASGQTLCTMTCCRRLFVQFSGARLPK